MNNHRLRLPCHWFCNGSRLNLVLPFFGDVPQLFTFKSLFQSLELKIESKGTSKFNFKSTIQTPFLKRYFGLKGTPKGTPKDTPKFNGYEGLLRRSPYTELT